MTSRNMWTKLVFRNMLVVLHSNSIVANPAAELFVLEKPTNWLNKQTNHDLLLLITVC